MSQIEQQFDVRNKEDSPSCYLGNFYKRDDKGNIHVSSTKHIKEVLRQFAKQCGEVRKQSIPVRTAKHPETDQSSCLNAEETQQFQHIIGVCQWLVVAGRFDINHAVSSLSRFSIAPQKRHLELAREIMGHLRKNPKRRHWINPLPPNVPSDCEVIAIKEDFGYQHSCFQEEIDPRFPTPLSSELEITIFVDADHGHDKVTGRSIAGLLRFVGSTPVMWSSKRQSSMQTSTFRAEFTALKKAVEEATAIRYCLRSMGVKVEKPTPICVDNMSVVLNASNPGSTLNKKAIMLLRHCTREHVANDAIEIRKIESEQNCSDPMTKALNSTNLHGFFYEIQSN